MEKEIIITPSVITEGTAQEVKADLAKFDLAKQQVSLLVFALTNHFTITTPDQQKEAYEVLKQASEVSKAIETKRVQLVKPFNDAVKQINDYAKRDLCKQIDDGITKVKAEILAFQKREEERTLRERTTARMNALAELGYVFDAASNTHKKGNITAISQREIEMLADDMWKHVMSAAVEAVKTSAQAELSAVQEDIDMIEAFGSDEDKVAAEEKRTAAEEIVTKDYSRGFAVSAPAPAKLNGAAKVWKFEVNDASLIPREYLMVDETLIRKAVAKGVREIPGVRIFQEDTLRIR